MPYLYARLMAKPDSLDRSEPLVVHQAGETVYANAAFISVVSAGSRDRVVGESVLEYVDSQYRDPFADQFRRIRHEDASALGMTLEVETPVRGSRKMIALSSPVEWEGADCVQTVFFETYEQLPSGLPADTMDASPIGITIASANREDEPLIYVNDGFVELTGYPHEEIVGRNCRFLQGEETDEGTVAEIREAIDAEEPITVELRNYRKGGSMFWNRLTITPIEDECGETTHFLGFQEDVTEKVVYEREKTLFGMQAEAVEQVIFITDAEGTIEYVNPQFERTTGYTAEEAIGKTPRILKSDQHEEAFFTELWETITAGEVWEAEITNRRKSGERYRSSQKIIPVTDADGAITHFVAIEEDITDAQFIEQVLDVMNRVLRHNVRNSVTAIGGYADLLESELDDVEHRSAINAIREHAETLGKISEETRTIRELFRRRHATHTLSVAAIEGFVDQRREQHPEAVIDLSIEVDDGLEIKNGSLLQLAIDEAIENAVVHNDRETPRVEVLVREIPDAAEIRIDIADDGPGIPDDQWAVIQAGQETQLAHSAGIGLWLMYWTVTALGGAIGRAENDPRGTVITYRVPIGTDEQVARWNSGEWRRDGE